MSQVEGPFPRSSPRTLRAMQIGTPRVFVTRTAGRNHVHPSSLSARSIVGEDGSNTTPPDAKEEVKERSPDRVSSSATRSTSVLAGSRTNLSPPCLVVPSRDGRAEKQLVSEPR